MNFSAPRFIKGNLFLNTEEKPEGKKRLPRGGLYVTSSFPPAFPLCLKKIEWHV